MTQSLDMNGHDGDFDKILKSPYIIPKKIKKIGNLRVASSYVT